MEPREWVLLATALVALAAAVFLTSRLTVLRRRLAEGNATAARVEVCTYDDGAAYRAAARS